MKLRVSRELHRAMLARSTLLGCDLGEIARRCLRGARVADACTRDSATRADSVPLTLEIPEELCAGRSGREIAGTIAARLAETEEQCRGQRRLSQRQKRRRTTRYVIVDAEGLA